MSKLQKLITMGLVTVLSTTTFLQAATPTMVNATTTSNVQVTSSNRNSSQESSSNKWQTITTKSGETMQILPDGSSRMSGKVRYNGEEHSYKITNANGVYTIYLDGEEVCSIDINNSQVPSSQTSSIFSPFINFSYANGKVAFKHAGRKYYLLATEKYSANTVRKANKATRDLILGLFGFVPVVGPYISAGTLAYSFFDTLFGKNPKNKWYTVKIYCTKGYEYYAWKTYTYKDSARKHLQSVKWVYKKVL